jgi:hypothetical protein
MRRLLAILLAGVVCHGGAAAAATLPVAVFSPFDGSARTLARLAPHSLRPAVPRVRLPEYHDNWSFSPDGSRVALGMGGAGDVCGRGICVVDMRSMTIAAQIHAPTAVEAVAWLRPRRIVGVLQTGGIIVGDPVTGAVVLRRDFPYDTFYPAVARTSAGFAVMFDSVPARLMLVDPRGEMRSVALNGIARNAGLAADRRTGRAFVVGAGRRVAVVDLRTMTVKYRRVRVPRMTRSREALWLGRGLLALWGGSGAGAHVVDTRTWSVRTVSRAATGVRRAAGRLLVYSDRRVGRAGRGIGLRVFTRDGARLVQHLFGTRKLSMEVAGGRAYVAGPDARGRRTAWIVDARSGERIRTLAPPRRAYDVRILGSRLGSGALPR